ncbi:MAG TPA: SAM-dependent chlorinase/fluorinase [Anaerolineales bacterium]|nr:SAM-dependent chlorinase/fluorinase [Anaerolineales bacterium]
MTTITLMTDFGIKDGNVGVMKGVIWNIAPEAHIADLSHMIGPQNIPEAALILSRSVPYFPPGAIHMVVVDPGVGTARRPMAARIGDAFYVGPDNGIITIWLERALEEDRTCEFVELQEPKYRLPVVSHVFHGRDIFSPAAGHLAAGAPLSAFGSAFNDPVKIELPKPTRTQHSFKGEVIHIDHFGNVSSNIRQEHLGEALKHKEKINVRVGDTMIKGMVDTFGERPAGDLVALISSTGYLFAAVVNGSAAQMLGSKVGDVVEAIF